MQPNAFPRLFATIGAAHFADQLALTALPLTAVVLMGAGPGLVGILVAVQGAAWLLVSLPAGVWVDRARRTRLIRGSQALAAAAFVGATLAASAGAPGLLGIAAFLGASGTVILVLASLALLPSLVPAAELPRANARVELARAVASLAAPLVVGALVERGAGSAAYALAAGAALAAVLAAGGLREPVSSAQAAIGVDRPPLLAAIRDGARFALRHDLLRGIVGCAVFWNFAFFALLAVAVPFALQRIGLDATRTGIMQGGYGVGLILGALAAGPVLRRVEPRVVLVAGPALSLLAALLLIAAPRGGGLAAGLAAYALLGFGPMLWLICQTSIRQLVTPPHLLGRVAALIQVAIYGVRPLGALAGGWLGALAGLDAALMLVLAGFALSTAVPLASALGRLRALPVAAVA